MKRFSKYIRENLYTVTIGEHPTSGDYIYVGTKTDKESRRVGEIPSSTLSFQSKFPPGRPGTPVDDHEHAEAHHRKLKGLLK